MKMPRCLRKRNALRTNSRLNLLNRRDEVFKCNRPCGRGANVGCSQASPYGVVRSYSGPDHERKVCLVLAVEKKIH